MILSKDTNNHIYTHIFIDFKSPISPIIIIISKLTTCIKLKFCMVVHLKLQICNNLWFEKIVLVIDYHNESYYWYFLNLKFIDFHFLTFNAFPDSNQCFFRRSRFFGEVSNKMKPAIS